MGISGKSHAVEAVRNGKPIASLSVDLDNQWSYMKTHGDPGWEAFPSYLDTVVPRMLSMLEERELRITFFVVGRDAAEPRNRQALESIAAAGHEIGNHSFNHNPWLHLYTEADLQREIGRAEDAIERATRQRPIGFRGPGYSLSNATLEVLERMDYLYDASILPTFIGPLARTYYFANSDLTKAEKQQRAALFGSFRDGLRPLGPYRWKREDGEGIIEIPVTTLPIFKVPFHMSYVLYLATFSARLAKLYFRTALNLCRLLGVQPSLLLHPLDFMGSDDLGELSFFPGMGMSSEEKLRIVSGFLGEIESRFEVTTVQRHAEEFAHKSAPATVEQGVGSGEPSRT